MRLRMTQRNAWRPKPAPAQALQGRGILKNPPLLLQTMCLVAWHWQPDHAHPLTLIANRDEYYARPAAPLAPWAGSPIWAGRDLEAGGTWLGATASGRVAVVTNYRDMAMQATGRTSRGELVQRFLESDAPAPDFVAELQARTADFNPFNLLVFDGWQLHGLEARLAHSRAVRLSPGVGAVSNADFFTPWPKLTRLREGLAGLLPTDQTPDQTLLDLLLHDEPVSDEALPQTGLPIERERALSSAFIRTPDYGTRAQPGAPERNANCPD